MRDSGIDKNAASVIFPQCASRSSRRLRSVFISAVTAALVTSLHSCKSASRIAGQFLAKDMMDRSVTCETLFSFNCLYVSLLKFQTYV